MTGYSQVLLRGRHFYCTKTSALYLVLALGCGEGVYTRHRANPCEFLVLLKMVSDEHEQLQDWLHEPVTIGDEAWDGRTVGNLAIAFEKLNWSWWMLASIYEPLCRYCPSKNVACIFSSFCLLTAILIVVTCICRSNEWLDLIPRMAASTRLFVGGLNPQLSEDELKSRFEKFGSVSDIQFKVKDIEG